MFGLSIEAFGGGYRGVRGRSGVRVVVVEEFCASCIVEPPAIAGSLEGGKTGEGLVPT